MKRFVSGFLAMMMLFVPVLAYGENATIETIEYDFKTFCWGDSRDAVIAVEGTPYIADGKVNGMDVEYIAYKTTAVGLDMLLAYYFCDDGLFRVRYISDETHSNESLYIDDYTSFKKALTKKYGNPLIDTEKWENDSKKSYYADRKGDALNYGYLTYLTIYSLDRSYISMSMSADNYEISMKVDYESKTIDPGEADFSDDI